MASAQSIAVRIPFELDEAAHTLRFNRSIPAEREAVFAAWTEPARVSQWWDPTGEPLATCEIDLRIGGRFTFEGQNHGAPFSGTYQEIRRPELLVLDVFGATGRVLIEPEGSGSALTVEIICRDAEHLSQFVSMGVHEGTGKTLDNLVSYLS